MLKDMLKGVIFDMDGVLVDNMDVHAEVFKLFCEKYGVREGAGDPKEYSGMGNGEIMRRVLLPEVIEKYGVEWLGDEKERMYREYYADKIEPSVGLVDFLKDIKGCGLKASVGSSGQKANVEFVLEKCNIAEYFDAAVNGDMVERQKPAPDIFLLAAEKLGLKPSECLVIEDAIMGIEAARSAGIKVVALTSTFDRETLAANNPDLIIDSFEELSCEKAKALFE